MILPSNTNTKPEESMLFSTEEEKMMTTSPSSSSVLLASCLNDIFTKKSISIENMNIVVDNAMLPTRSLVAQAVESIVLEDSPRGRDGTTIDQLGLSCRCVFHESECFSDCSINSEESCDMMEDVDKDFLVMGPPSEPSPAEPVRKDTRWKSTSLPANLSEGGLVCPVRPSSLSSSSNHINKLDLIQPTRGVKRTSSSTRNWAALLDRATHSGLSATPGQEQRRRHHQDQTSTSKENRMKLLDQAISLVSEEVKNGTMKQSN